jgi:Ca2+-binding RTX toxin-like protein
MALFTGDSSNNTLNGGDGNDTLRGLAGDDSLNGGLGNDLLEGGDGNDLLNESGDSTGYDTLDGGSGDDVYAIYSSNTTIREGLTGGNDTIWTAVNYALAVPSFTLTDSINIESIYVTGNATVSGNGLNNFIAGYGADDHVISGLGGNDRLYGGSGKDTLNGGDEDDYLNGGTGINLLIGGNGNDTLDGDGSTSNTLQGGKGDDVYGIYDTNTVIVELDGDGNDSAWVNVDYTLQDANGSIETIYAIGGNTISGNSSNNTIFSLGLGAQTLNGFGGNDKLFAVSYQDTLNGGDGDDTLDGGGGNAELNGGDGNDVLYSVSTGIYTGGNGDDNYGIYSIESSAIEAADGGNDTVWSLHDFSLTDNVENLYLIGTASGSGNIEDNLIVGLGDGYGDGQTINGLGGKDTINGAGGNDYIIGGQGSDILIGGADGDTFAFSSQPTGGGVPAQAPAGIAAPILESESSYLNTDKIQDFTIGQDLIDLGRDVFSLTRSANNSTATTLLDLVQAAVTDSDGAMAGNQALGISDAVIIESTNTGIAGTYLIVNNDNNTNLGLNDLVINITGYSGMLDGPGVISQQIFTVLPQS